MRVLCTSSYVLFTVLYSHLLHRLLAFLRRVQRRVREHGGRARARTESKRSPAKGALFRWFVTGAGPVNLHPQTHTVRKKKVESGPRSVRGPKLRNTLCTLVLTRVYFPRLNTATSFLYNPRAQVLPRGYSRIP